MSYVLRLLLPDRPGTLGAVATALGLVDADILAMDIVERSPDQAVDDIVVSLPSGRRQVSRAWGRGGRRALMHGGRRRLGSGRQGDGVGERGVLCARLLDGHC